MMRLALIITSAIAGASLAPNMGAAQEVPLVCKFVSEHGSTWKESFKIDLDTGRATIGSGGEVVPKDDFVTIFWDSVECQHLNASGEKGICMKNIVDLDRSTLTLRGLVDKIGVSGECEIRKTSRKF